MLEDLRIVIDLLKEIGNAANGLKNGNKEITIRYFKQISGCLNEISESFLKDEIPVSEISELRHLLEELPETVELIIGKDKKKLLSNLLINVIVEQAEKVKSNKKAVRQIQEIAGQFEAIVFMLDNPIGSPIPWKKILVTLFIPTLLAFIGIFFTIKYFTFKGRLENSQIYLHYFKESDLKILESLKEELKVKNVPVIHNINVSEKYPHVEAPQEIQIRYYWDQDQETAKFLKDLVQQQNPNSRVNIVPRLSANSGTHSGQVELWMSN